MSSLTIERMYWLPYCSTCTKAEQYLKDKGASIQTYINVKEETVSEATLKEICERMGGVDKLFSKRAMKYRAWGLNEKELSDEEMLQYMQQEYTFIKRPVIITTDQQVLAGFSAKQYDQLFK
ncbi:arsenate reductase family protein [Vampirovibrio sp.]|uniref:arsenate reductase family protein n=1 Tax=Vampirovibrio sp. TaxID=2717857 RepID=UPI003593FBD6